MGFKEVVLQTGEIRVEQCQVAVKLDPAFLRFGQCDIKNVESLNQPGFVIEVLTDRCPLDACVTTLHPYLRVFEIVIIHHLHHREYLAVVRGFPHIGTSPQNASDSHFVASRYPRTDIVRTEACGAVSHQQVSRKRHHDQFRLRLRCHRLHGACGSYGQENSC